MRLPDRGNDSGGILGIRRSLCKRFLCRERHDKKALRILEWAVSAVLAVIMVFWLYRQGFCAREYTNYGAIIWPGVTFLTLTLLVTLWRIFMPSAPGEEKLLSGLIFLIVLITSLGSNNKLYPSMNNLFLALPYMYWQFYRFCKYAGSFRWKRMTISPIPAKCLFGGFFCYFYPGGTVWQKLCICRRHRCTGDQCAGDQ